jgi:undecaprenyl-diphosphatase
MSVYATLVWLAQVGAVTPSVAPSVTTGATRRVRAAVATLLTEVVAIDVATMNVLVAIRSPLLTKVMTSVTGLGSATAAVVFLGIFYLAGWRRELAVGVVAIGVVGLVVPALMSLVQRPFPSDPVCVTAGSGLTPHSFPSGHAAAVTVFALVSHASENLPFRIVTALAATVAVSRIYLGTHYLSDTVVGIVIGVVGFAAGRALAPRVRPLIPE